MGVDPMVSNSVLNVKALVGAFNQEKALVGAFLCCDCETGCGTDGALHSTIPDISLSASTTTDQSQPILTALRHSGLGWVKYGGNKIYKFSKNCVIICLSCNLFIRH